MFIGFYWMCVVSDGVWRSRLYWFLLVCFGFYLILIVSDGFWRSRF